MRFVPCTRRLFNVAVRDYFQGTGWCRNSVRSRPRLFRGVRKGGNVMRENTSRRRVQGWPPAAVWPHCPAYLRETGEPVPRCERRCTMEGRNRRISHPRCLWHDTILARIYPEKVSHFFKIFKTHHFLIMTHHKSLCQRLLLTSALGILPR